MSTAVARPPSSEHVWRPQPHRWTRAAYELAVAAGAFEPQGEDLVGARVELLDGEIVQMPPQGPPHISGIGRAMRVLSRALDGLPSGQAHLRIQGPLALDDRSEPEPDLAIVPGDLSDYDDVHPTTALLVIEVARATLRYDRTRKAAAYARNGVPEYWILNLRDRQLEVLRDPLGDTYRQQSVHGPSARVAAIALPGLVVTVADLLP